MKKIIVTGLTMALSQACLAEGTPWLPEPGATSVTLSQVLQTGDEFFINKEDANLPDDLEQSTTWLGLNYGLSDDLSLDFRTGYARSTFEPADPTHLTGRTDSSVGINWRVIDEFISENNLPSTVIRVGAVLQGNYTTGAINSVGDGADALELSVISGKILNQWLAVSGELGYRLRNSGVPDDIFYKLGAFVTPLPGLTASVSYSNTDARDGLYIGGPGFTGNNFQELEEDNQIIDIGLSYSLTNQLSAGLNAAKVIDGRNTAKSEIYALTLGYSL